MVKTKSDAPVKENPQAALAKTMEIMSPQIKKALPNTIKPERFVRIVTTVINSNPKLLTCDRTSLLAAVLTSAQFGLEPNTYGECYFIPYGNQVQFQLGYRGMLKLIRNSGCLAKISTRVVYENDDFNIEYGIDEKVFHRPSSGDPGQFIGVYAIAKLTDGSLQIEYMTKPEVDRIRSKSKSSNNGPWATDYTEMARKTVLKRISKYLPMSADSARMIESDGLVRGVIDANMTEVPGSNPDYDIDESADQKEIPTDKLNSQMQDRIKETFDAE